MDAQRDRLFRAVDRLPCAISGAGESVRTPCLRSSDVTTASTAYGAADYDVFGRALITALERYSEDVWVPELRGGLGAGAYDAVATKMLRGAEQDPREPAYWPAEVVAHERRGRDVAVFTCVPLYEFTFRPGQYVNLESPHQPRVWRPYSIANAPRPDGSLEFHVRALGGWVSAALVRRLIVGNVVNLGPPMGVMVLDRHSTRDLVCVAGGTGLAPIKALVDG